MDLTAIIIEVRGIADRIDEKLDDENRDRQLIAEEAAVSLRSLAGLLVIDGARQEVDVLRAACTYCRQPFTGSLNDHYDNCNAYETAHLEDWE